MESTLYSTDRKVISRPEPFYKRKSIHAAYIIPLLIASSVILFKARYSKKAFAYSISQINNSRNRIKIFLEPGNTISLPSYILGKLDDSTFYLEIEDCDVSRYLNRSFTYGSVSQINADKLKDDKIRVNISFSSLKDIPVVEFIDDPPRLEIGYNRYLDDKYIVVIDPGHGGRYPGAIGRNGTREKDVTLNIALSLKEYLKERDDIEVVLTRERDSTIGLFARREMSRFWNADIFISIHANSARNRLVNQTEIYYAGNNSYSLARTIRDELYTTLNNGLGKIRRRGFAVIRRNSASMGAVLVESMYLSNSAGEKYLSVSENRDRIAQGLYRSISRTLSRTN